MPYIRLEVTDDGVTREQKDRVVREFTETLVRVLGKRPEHIHIVIQEVPEQNWGFSGMLTDEYRGRRTTASATHGANEAGHGS